MIDSLGKRDSSQLVIGREFAPKFKACFRVEAAVSPILNKMKKIGSYFVQAGTLGAIGYSVKRISTPSDGGPDALNLLMLGASSVAFLAHQFFVRKCSLPCIRENNRESVPLETIPEEEEELSVAEIVIDSSESL